MERELRCRGRGGLQEGGGVVEFLLAPREKLEEKGGELGGGREG